MRLCGCLPICSLALHIHKIVRALGSPWDALKSNKRNAKDQGI